MKNRFIAAFFAFFFGWIGLNEFYLGNKNVGWVEVIVSVFLWWIGGGITRKCDPRMPVPFLFMR